MHVVGENPLRMFAGQIVAVSAPVVTVRISDPADPEDDAVEITATGTGAVNDKVQVLVWPNGRAVLMKG